MKHIAFPPLGTGEFNYPVDLCASTLYKCIKKHQLRSEEFPSEVLIMIDSRIQDAEEIKEVSCDKHVTFGKQGEHIVLSTQQIVRI